MSQGEIDENRAEEPARLRARLVVNERATMAALELVLRVRPEDLGTFIEITRKRLSEAYQDARFAPDLTRADERGLRGARGRAVAAGTSA